MDEESRKYWAGAEVIRGSDGDGEGQGITSAVGVVFLDQTLFQVSWVSAASLYVKYISGHHHFDIGL